MMSRCVISQAPHWFEQTAVCSLDARQGPERPGIGGVSADVSGFICPSIQRISRCPKYNSPDSPVALNLVVVHGSDPVQSPVIFWDLDDRKPSLQTP
ncbi:hypothetical protein VTH06DRAFT_2614 [Thermothelomyces fergusii]